MKALLFIVCLVTSCAPPFEPAYPGEPDCGRAMVIHAVIGAPCDPEVVAVACDCTDRQTLRCVDGVWAFRHDVCTAGLSTSGGAQ